jgi:hypothetical protein
VVLPQQFSHCLRARDANVRFVRASLLVKALVFSGDIAVSRLRVAARAIK